MSLENKDLVTKEKKIDSAVQAASEPQKPANIPAAASPQPAGEPFCTHGEKTHDRLVTWWVDYGLNSAVGVSSSVLSERTKFGQNWISGPMINGAKKLFGSKPFNKVLNTPWKQAEGAKWVFRIFSIMMGGFAIIPLMTWLEKPKNKLAYIRKHDERHYGKEEVENNPKFAEAYQRIANEPPKSFWIGNVARGIALAPIIAAVTIAPEFLQKRVYDPLGNALKWSEHNALKLVGLRKGAAKYIDSAVETEKLPIGDYVHRMIGFDFGLTPVYALLHKWSFDTLAALWHKKTEPEKTVTQEKTEAPPAVTSDQPPAKTYTASITPRAERSAEAPPADYTQKLADSRDPYLQQAL